MKITNHADIYQNILVCKCGRNRTNRHIVSVFLDGEEGQVECGVCGKTLVFLR